MVKSLKYGDVKQITRMSSKLKAVQEMFCRSPPTMMPTSPAFYDISGIHLENHNSIYCIYSKSWHISGLTFAWIGLQPLVVSYIGVINKYIYLTCGLARVESLGISPRCNFIFSIKLVNFCNALHKVSNLCSFIPPPPSFRGH